MKTKSLKVKNSCHENWDKMSLNDKGRFCNSCAKTVMDFTSLDNKSIFKILKSSKGNVCGKLTASQLETPYLDIKEQKQYKLPYSKTAAGIILVTTLASVQSCNTEAIKINTEVLAYNDVSSINKETNRKTIEETVIENTVMFSGKVIRDDGSGIENARITLITLDRLYTFYSQGDGLFSIELPLEIVNDANVFRFEYSDIVRLKRNERRYADYFKTENKVILKSEIELGCNIDATRDTLALGLVLSYYNIPNDEKKRPVVINNGIEVGFEEFIKAVRGKKSSCNIKDKEHIYFKPEAAIALYGEKAKYGLYFFSKEIKQHY